LEKFFSGAKNGLTGFGLAGNVIATEGRGTRLNSGRNCGIRSRLPDFFVQQAAIYVSGIQCFTDLPGL